MGKKTREKGAKKEKEEKLKKEPVKTTTAAVREALEAISMDKGAPAHYRPVAGKKSERSVNVKVGCVESFRWEAKESPPKLPPLPMLDLELTIFSRIRSRAPKNKSTNIGWGHFLNNGWSEFLKQRFRGHRALLEVALKSTALKDGLSGPLSVVHLIYRLSARLSGDNNRQVLDNLNTNAPLHIVLVGASAANEEKILKETNYWEEVGILLGGRQVHLYLTGLEMSGNYSVCKTDDRQDLAMPVECWKGNAADFLLQSGRLETFQTEETYVVGLNPGFGAASVQVAKNLHKDVPAADVIWSWLPSLYLMAALDLPMLFTSSSREGVEYMAVVLQCVVGTYTLGIKSESKLHFDSCVYVGEGQEPVRANSYMVIVRGQQPGMDPFSSTPDTPVPRLEELKKVFRTARASMATVPVHHTVPDGEWSHRKQMLAPLKRYGNYPPDAAAEAAAEAEHIAYLRRKELATSKDAEIEPNSPRHERGGTMGEGEEEGTGEEREMLPGESLGRNKCFGWVALGCLISIHVRAEDVRELVVTLKDVFLVDPRTARVGVKTYSFELYYTDCHLFRRVGYEDYFPDGVDHTTARVVFIPSLAQVKITVRLLPD